MKKYIFCIMSFVSFTLSLFGTTFRVPDDYSTISLAIEAAENLTGSVTIEVEGGTYNENLLINLTYSGLSNLSLIGIDGASDCIINGNDTGDVISIYGNYDNSINITGFTITGSGVELEDRGIDVNFVDFSLSESIINLCKYAIYVHGSNNIECIGNEFYSYEFTSISSLFRLYRIEKFNIQDNYFENLNNLANRAISLQGSEGIILNNSFINFAQSIALWYFANSENGNIKIDRNNFNRIMQNSSAGSEIFVMQCNDLFITNNSFESDISFTGQNIAIHVSAANNDENYAKIIGNLFTNYEYCYYSIGSYSTEYYTADLINNTFCNSTLSAIYLSESNSLQYCKNNIFYNNENDVITNSLNTFGITPTISFNSLGENILMQYPTWLGGNNQINVDPRFNIGEYTLFYESELNKSPCIDAGDPDTDGDDDDWLIDEDDRDIDGSRKDMGCYPYLHDYDTKHFSPGWQWLSFPILTEQGVFPQLNGQVFEHAYWNEFEQIPGLFQLTSGGSTTIDGLVKIEGKDKYITYDEEEGFIPFNFDNMLFRHEGYKVELATSATASYLGVDGERLSADHTIDGTMNSGEYHWLGYWLLNTPQSIVDAFGDFWQSVAKVKSEDWFYSPSNNQRGADPKIPVLLSPENLTFEYGKTYLVQFNEPVEDFYWTDSNVTTETEKKAEPESFTYTEKADYEAIDVFNIPPNVSEIGVFEDDICVGAVVVEDTCTQILVYSENANRNPIPFTFEVVTGRGFSTPIKNYQVMDMETGKYETKSIFSSRQEYSIMRFSDEEELEDNILLTPQLHGNYPNPFNPTTTISFSLPEEQEIDLTIYNIKGQKVKRLIDGQLTSGQHSITWDGKDTNGKSVSTGIYFYRLKTGKKEISRKMLLLK